MGEVKNVVFGKYELDYQDISQLKALLLLLVHQHSDSDVGNKIKIFSKQVVFLKYKYGSTA